MTDRKVIQIWYGLNLRPEVNYRGERITPKTNKSTPPAAEIDALLIKTIETPESENPVIEIDKLKLEINKLKQSLGRAGTAVLNQEKEIQRLQKLLQQAYERALP